MDVHMDMGMESKVESFAPELLPLWLRHRHQIPKELVADLGVGRVRNLTTCCAFGRSIPPFCYRTISNWDVDITADHQNRGWSYP